MSAPDVGNPAGHPAFGSMLLRTDCGPGAGNGSCRMMLRPTFAAIASSIPRTNTCRAAGSPSCRTATIAHGAPMRSRAALHKLSMRRIGSLSEARSTFMATSVARRLVLQRNSAVARDRRLVTMRRLVCFACGMTMARQLISLAYSTTDRYYSCQLSPCPSASTVGWVRPSGGRRVGSARRKDRTAILVGNRDFWSWDRLLRRLPRPIISISRSDMTTKLVTILTITADFAASPPGGGAGCGRKKGAEGKSPPHRQGRSGR